MLQLPHCWTTRERVSTEVSSFHSNFPRFIELSIFYLFFSSLRIQRNSHRDTTFRMWRSYTFTLRYVSPVPLSSSIVLHRASPQFSHPLFVRPFPSVFSFRPFIFPFGRRHAPNIETKKKPTCPLSRCKLTSRGETMDRQDDPSRENRQWGFSL